MLAAVVVSIRANRNCEVVQQRKDDRNRNKLADDAARSPVQCKTPHDNVSAAYDKKSKTIGKNHEEVALKKACVVCWQNFAVKSSHQ